MIYLPFVCLLAAQASNVDASCTVDRSRNYSVVVDCRNNNLTALPCDLPRDLTELLLSHNNLSHIENEAFSNFTHMKLLTLNHNKLAILPVDTFRGLQNLEYLDLSFNFLSMNYTSFPVGIFQGLPRLTTLKISSQQPGLQRNSSEWSTLGDVIGKLTSLESLIMSVLGPRDSEKVFILDMGYENLNNLQSLVIYGSVCYMGYLEDRSLHALRKSPLKNLTIRHCGLRGLTSGVFLPVPGLRQLNLACNSAGFDNLTAALNNNPSMRLHTLIVDNIQESPMGLLEKHVCMPALQELKRYSIRHNEIILLDVCVFACLQTLEYVAFGFNPVLRGVPDDWRPLLYSLLDNVTLITIDASYTLSMGSDQFYLMYKYPPELDTEDYIRKPPEFLLPEVYNNETIPLHRHNSSRHHEIFWENTPSTWKVIFGDNSGMDLPYNISDINVNTDNHLLYINLSHTGAETMRPPLTGFHHLQVLDLSHSRLRLIQPGALDDLPSMRRLLLHHNKLGTQQRPFRDCFSMMDNLEMFDLSYNTISTLHPETFSNLPNMTHLNLSHNFIQDMDMQFNLSHQLQHLNLSHNKINFLPETLTTQLDAIVLDIPLVVDLRNNPFLCGCDSIHFLRWTKSTNVCLPGKTFFTCSKNNQTVSMLSVNVDLLEVECAPSPRVSLPLIISVPSVVCLIIVVMTSLLYRYRWHMRWHFYLLRRWIRMRNHGDEFGEIEKFKYCAFVAHNHDADIKWVMNNLLPEAEGHWGLRLCIGYRDFLPGIPIVENIVSAIDQSFRTLLIVTPDFVASEWCDFETHMALTKGRKHVIVCLMSPVPFEDMCAALRALVKLNNYIEWSEDPQGQQLFWERLRVTLTESREADA